MTSQGSNSHPRTRATAAWAATALMVAAAGAATANDAEVYKWVDDNGVVHYSDVPDAAGAVETGIRFGRTDARRVREEQLRDWEQAQDQAEEEAAQREEQRVAQERQAEDRQIQSDRCAAARQRAESYGGAHRLYEPLPNGERRYLTAEETTAAREAAERAVEEWCK